MKGLKRYELYNHEGCYFASTMDTSFRSARSHFADLYIGEFIIYCGDEGKNVILK